MDNAGTTLREDLEASLEDVTPDTPAPTEPVTPEPVETEEQKAGRTAGRARDEQGRLLPGKPVKDAAPQAPVVETPALKPPSTWKREYVPLFDKLATGQPLTAEESRKLAEYAGVRESEFAKGVSTYKNEWEQAKPLLDAIAPFQPLLQQHNIQPGQWISNLGNAHKALALGSPQDKLAMFQKLAADYQIPAQLAVQDQNGQWQLLAAQQYQQQPQFSPQAINQMVEAKFTEHVTQQEIASFGKTHQHFETVRNTMAGLLQSNVAPDLESAYEKAIRLHDDIWQQEQEAKAKTDVAEKLKQTQQTTQRAKANAVSPRSATTSAAMTTAKGDKGLREQLEETYDEIAAGRV